MTCMSVAPYLPTSPSPHQLDRQPIKQLRMRRPIASRAETGWFGSFAAMTSSIVARSGVVPEANA